jgi:GNAT superfamily N-acetyltransferase
MLSQFLLPFFRGKEDPKGSFDEYSKTFPELHSAVMATFDELMYPGDIFMKYRDCHKIYDMFALATHPDYRGKGIAGHLLPTGVVSHREELIQCIALNMH